MLPKLREIVDHHLRGTRFGIGVDPADGLLRQGAEGYQLTWMDAKVGDWVVTPRRGKAVEINALWYNALRLLERWARPSGRRRDAPARSARLADAGVRSFNRRFWYEEAGYLYDVVDGETGDDPRLPAQPGLRHLAATPGARPARWAAVLDVGRATAAHAGRPALAGARPSRLQADVLRRPARPRRRLPPGDGLGLADRSLHRRLAAAPSRRPQGSARLPAGFDAWTRLRRLHQRDLRRRGALHPPRLHRPGLERGRGAPVLVQDRGVIKKGQPALTGCPL